MQQHQIYFKRSFLQRILKPIDVFLYSSGGLPGGLRITPTGITSPANANTSTSQPSDTNRTGPSNDPNNYAGVFAQMLNMMSNQNIVCSIKYFSSKFLLLGQNTPPNQRYAVQLEQLVSMGFTNRDANLQGNPILPNSSSTNIHFFSFDSNHGRCQCCSRTSSFSKLT